MRPLDHFARFFTGASPAAAQVKLGFPGAAHRRGCDRRGVGENRRRDGREKINGSGGVLGQKIELVIYDDRPRPKRQCSRPTSSSARTA